jgi:hypothetical protein
LVGFKIRVVVSFLSSIPTRRCFCLGWYTVLRVKGFSTSPTVDLGLYHNYADAAIRELSFIRPKAHNCRSCEIVELAEEMSEMPAMAHAGGSNPFRKSVGLGRGRTSSSEWFSFFCLCFSPFALQQCSGGLHYFGHKAATRLSRMMAWDTRPAAAPQISASRGRRQEEASISPDGVLCALHCPSSFSPLFSCIHSN